MMSTDIDSINKQTRYTHKLTPKLGRVSDVSLFVVTKNEKPTVFLRTSLISEDWLFYKSILLSGGGKKLEITPPALGVTQEILGAKRLMELYDHPLTVTQLSTLETILKSNDVTLRLTGRKFYRDRTLTGEEVGRMLITMFHSQALRSKN